MKSLRERTSRRLRPLLVAALALAGCTTLRVWQAPDAPRAAEADPVCMGEFYLPYAALAADVYRTRGTSIERLQLVVNPDMIQRITNGRDITPDHVRQLFERARKRACPAAGSTGRPDPLGSAALTCLDGPQADEVFAAVFNAGDEAFDDAVPTSPEQCAGRGAERTRVPVTEVARAAGWSRVRELDKYATTRKWRVFVPDLAIEVWRRTRTDAAAVGRLEYAIVYRGTTGAGGWFSNFRPVTAMLPIFWDQYQQAASSARRIVEQIYMIEILRRQWQHEEREKTARPGADVSAGTEPELPLITMVGHSLGAGLARYAYLKIPEATRVIGFNPSPIDGGHMLLPLAEREQVMAHRRTDPGTHCPAPRSPGGDAAHMFFLYEQGEALTEVLPCVSGPEWGAEGGPISLCQQVDLSHGNPIRQHAMSLLACRLSHRHVGGPVTAQPTPVRDALRGLASAGPATRPVSSIESFAVEGPRK